MTLSWDPGYLEDFPEIAYEMYRPKTGGWNYQEYWKQRQDRSRSQYLATEAQARSSGQPFTQSYVQYLMGYPFLRNWAQLSPAAKGTRMSQYSPNIRWAV